MPAPAADPRLAAWLASLQARGAVSAAVAAIAVDGRLDAWAAVGERVAGGPAADLDSRFDLASLTKPAVATLALALDDRGALPLAARVGDLWPSAHRALARRQLGTLLRHRAGLAAWTPLAARCRHRRQVATLLTTAEDLLGAAAGTYSDLGYILWGLAAERRLGVPLAALLARHLTEPLAIAGLEPSPGAADDVVACQLDNAVERRLAAAQNRCLAPSGPPPHGRAQDGNARFLGGLGGHAGLFGNARQVLGLAAAWLRPGGLPSPAAAARALGGRGPYALGWARRRLRGSAGPALPASAFGHIGFVGSSLWLDPEAGRVYLLLAHRRRASGDFNRWRRAFHRLASTL